MRSSRACIDGEPSADGFHFDASCRDWMRYDLLVALTPSGGSAILQRS